jgi:hypothetical protein
LDIVRHVGGHWRRGIHVGQRVSSFHIRGVATRINDGGVIRRRGRGRFGLGIGRPHVEYIGFGRRGLCRDAFYELGLGMGMCLKQACDGQRRIRWIYTFLKFLFSSPLRAAWPLQGTFLAKLESPQVIFINESGPHDVISG